MSTLQQWRDRRRDRRESGRKAAGRYMDACEALLRYEDPQDAGTYRELKDGAWTARAAVPWWYRGVLDWRVMRRLKQHGRPS